MIETGKIICHVQTNPTGIRERIDYEWQGAPVIWIHPHFYREVNPGPEPKEGDSFRIGPYLLMVIEFDPYHGSFLCIREDYPLWPLVVFWHRFGKIADLACRRLIITLAVWNLARYNPAVVPHWTDIDVLRRIAGWNLFNRFAKFISGGKVLYFPDLFRRSQ